MAVEFLLPIIWLLVVSFSFGFVLTREKNLMASGFGLAAFCVLSIILNLLHIPLNWLLFLLLALVALGWMIYKKELKLEMPQMPDKTLMLVLLMAFINIYVFYVGATSYPWLEDDDPWLHAMGAKWVAETGSYSRSFDPDNFVRMYIEPYPPGYDVLMGVLHQLLPSVSETLKFFNCFLIGATLVIAFYSIEALTRDRRLALFATFFLLVLPAFMGHFIWAQTLAMLLLFVALYGMEKAFEADLDGKNRWIIAAGIAIGAIPIVQPSTAAIFLMFALVFMAAKLISCKRITKESLISLKPLVLAGVIALLATAAYYVPVLMKYGPKYTADGIGMFTGLFTPGATDDTSGGIVYSAQDFLIVQSQGKIDQQIGIGIVLAVLAVLGFILALNEIRLGKKEPWLVCSSILLVLCFLGVEGNMMPVKLFPHRFWVFLAIPVAILGAHAYLWIEKKAEKRKTILLAALLIGAFITSAAGKIAVQTSQWPPGMLFYSQDDISGYLSLQKSAPAGTKVFPLCAPDSKVIGLDMSSEPYIPEYEIFKRTAINRSAKEVHDFISARNYSILVIDGSCVDALGPVKANMVASEYLTSPLFEKAFSNQGMIVLRVR